jgi:hypothetical protein
VSEYLFKKKGMRKHKCENAKRELVMQMQKCEKAIDICDATGFPRSANAMRMNGIGLKMDSHYYQP